MHVPDGVLSPLLCLSTVPLASAAVAFSLWNWRKELLRQPTATPSILQAAGVGCAIFAMQMCNFAIPGQGFSGHLMGGALATILLGPWAACLIMAVILTIQASLFGDGGLSALGINILNMGVIPVAITAFMLQKLPASATGSLALRALTWFSVSALSVMAAVLALGVQLALGATATINGTQTALLLLQTHVPIALGEGMITTLLAAIVLPYEATTRVRILFVLALCILPLTPTASILPDGLEATGEIAGFLASAQTWETWLPDYTIPGLVTPYWSTALAGLVGLATTASALLLLAEMIVIGQKSTRQPLES
ncbi:energy-coupling factor ABC transporter permease [Planctopirus hydrillae]|uniref:Uncharacterized protein n=1 Tax=Planctopirus hydrillae TaxID=1841610 RepID=A0A1C3ESV9_9PLAN|nr:energy-coupling factor ABC transporter permease [Planctopirus hydrillae]ODA36338.1 hypothetical protein A6X21_16140 [Planctopirus hydrillae]